MILNRRLRALLFSSPKPLESFSHTQRSTYVDVTMKWKKDRFFDSIDILNKSKDLRPLMSLKNIISREPNHCIPISTVSKRGRELEISGRVAGFLRRYPAVFEEFTGPNYNLPWFKLTQEAADLDRLEQSIYENHRVELMDRLRRLILISKEKVLPFRIIQGMLWYLGLPEHFLQNQENISNGYFEIAEMGDGEQGLKAVIDPNKPVLSVIQRNAMKKMDELSETQPIRIEIPLFPSKGLRLKQKIENWLKEFQDIPYVSPYEDSSGLDPNCDVSEKRVVGVLHELLSLFVDNSAERRRLLCLRKHLALPQKFHKAFERHPHVFYLHLKSKTCFVVLKEAYCGGSATAIGRHPMLEVRRKYVRLMSKSEEILRNRRRFGKQWKELKDTSFDDGASGSETTKDGSDGFDEVMEEGIQS